MKETYQLEKDKVLENYIESFFMNHRNRFSSSEIPAVELIITSACNLKCSYCYLKNFGDDLYPKELRNSEVIVNNARKFVRYLITNRYKCNIDLFSGEPLVQELGYAVMEAIYEELKDAEYNPVKAIFIPTNASFINNDYYRNKYIDIHSRLGEIGVPVWLSASIDGKYLDDDTRSYINKSTRDDEYYDNIFRFGKKYGMGYHPMVSSYKIDRWIENFDWWMSKYKEFDINKNMYLMMLEVRNDDWDYESIEHYMKFINHVVNFRMSLVDNDPELFYKENFIKHHQYNDIVIRFNNTNSDKISCSIQNALFVRLGDLAIVPCHRTMYNQFLYGRFDHDEESINGVTSLNNPLMMSITSPLSSHQPFCSNCPIKYICPKGCLGSQYEATDNLFIPIDSVCELYKTKFAFLYNKYKQNGVLDYINKVDPTFYKELESIKERLGDGYDERCIRIIHAE